MEKITIISIEMTGTFTREMRSDRTMVERSIVDIASIKKEVYIAGICPYQIFPRATFEALEKAPGVMKKIGTIDGTKGD